MFRFTIRELVLLTMVVAMGVAWWIDRRRLVAISNESRQLADNLLADRNLLGFKLIAAEAFPKGDGRIREIHDSARQTPPSLEAVAEILHYARNDPDYRIRIRAIGTIPLLGKPEETVAVLLECLGERDAESTGEGLVPMYAASSLATMKVTAAIPEIRRWIDFLKQGSPYDAEVTPALIKSSETRLRQLEAANSATGENAP